MSAKLDFVEVVTREHGEAFADEWLERSRDTGVITEACAEAGIVEWHSEPSNDVVTYYASIENEIAQRVSDQLRSAVVETFVRLANAVIEQERMRTEASSVPPRIETVAIVTPEHGQAFAQSWYECDGMMTACYDTGIMKWPDGTLEDHAAQDHFDDLEDEILYEVFEATKHAIAEAFVKAANAVLDRERRRDA